MFRPAKIYHVRNFVPKDKVDKLVRALHGAGVCQIKEAEANIPSKFELPEITEIDEMQLSLGKVIDTLDDYRPVVQPENFVKGLFFPAEPEKFSAELLSTKRIILQAGNYLGKVEPTVVKLSSKLKEARKKVSENNYFISNLLLLPNENTSLFKSTDNISLLLGIVSPKSLEKIRAWLLKETVFAVKEIDEKQLLLAVAAETENAEAIDKLLHDEGFVPTPVPFENRKPAEIIKMLKKKNSDLLKEEKEVEKQFKELWEEHSQSLYSLNESLDICKERIDAVRKMKISESFSVLEAWVPEKNIKEFNKIIERTAGSYYAEGGEREDAPTIFNNPRIFKPFEILTELYSPPKYREFDPTPVIAVSFSLFFGFMLTDVVYGVLLALIAFGIYKGIGKINPGMRKFGALLMVLGMSTAVLGVLFGSYFGDMLQRLGLPIPALIDPMQGVMVVIAVSIIIGALHVLTGLVIGYREHIKKKQLLKAVSNQGVWIIFLVGAVIALVGGSLFSTVGIALIILSVLIQIATKFMESGAVVSGISVFNFAGFVGDIFSYARLTALAVGTAGIALAVNFMCLLIIELIPIIGLPIAIVVFFIGHLFNMLMNGLGAFIHSLRLHFLEFFTKFYDGGGKVYRPFYAYRKIKPKEVK